jgi:osmotically-inducible protein OsmY
MSAVTGKSDQDLRDTVVRELAWDPLVDETPITVQASDGVVTLAGVVDSDFARTAAVTAAHRVAGVLDVANELEVRSTRTDAEMTDAELAHAAREGLEWDAIAPAQQLHVTVAHGVITLTGTVDTIAERDDAKRSVEGLRGVRRVDNKLDVRQSPEPAKVMGAIESALARQTAREVSQLRITVHEGHVIIEGTVHSAAERRAILGAIHGTRGVVSVDDRLVVPPDPREPP